MFKNCLICQQKIQIEAQNFPSDCADWSIFEADFDAHDFSVKCKVTEPLPEVDGFLCGKSGDYSVFCKDSTVFRKREIGKLQGSLTKYDCKNSSECEVYFTPKSFPVFMDERYFWTSVPLAQLLLPKKAVLMHASYIDIGGSAVLFSAPCGTGKSTQAELWRVHRNAQVINGDKAGVYLKDGKAFAGGVPFCGTSQICKNRDLPPDIEDFGECRNPNGDRITCRAGLSSYWVTYDGFMLPCGMIPQPKSEIKAFKDSFNFIRQEREKIILPAKCKDCNFKKVCDNCAAVAFAETGSFSEAPEYACKKAQAYAKLAKSLEFNDKY